MTALLLAAMLALHALVGAKAAVSLELVMEDASGIRSVMREGDGLMIHTRRGLYAWQAGEEDARQLLAFDESDAALDALLMDGDALWGLMAEQQQLIPLTLGEKSLQRGVPIPLGIAPLLREAVGEDGVFSLPGQALIFDGRLYLIYRGMQEDRPVSAMLSFSLADGAGKWHRDMPIQCLAPYRDGQLLALALDEAVYFNPETPQHRAPMLTVYDPADDSLRELGPAGVDYRRHAHSMAYDPRTDTVYLTSGGSVYSGRPGEKMALLADAPRGDVTAVGRLVLLPPDRIAMAAGNTLLVRGTGPAEGEMPRLKVFGEMAGPQLWSAVEALRGQIMVQANEISPYRDMKDLAEALLLGDNSADVYCLNSAQFDLAAIRRKGYCADLSESPALTNYVATLYPQMQELAWEGDRLLMIPYQTFSETLAYHPAYFEALGLPVPNTFGALCDLIQTWNDEYADIWPDYRPIPTGDPMQLLARLAMAVYTNHCANTGEAFSYQSPRLRSLLERAQAVRYDNIQGNTQASRNLIEDGYYSFDPWMLSSGLDQPESTLPFVVAIDDGAPAVVEQDLYLFVVNPRSANLPAAIRFLETYIGLLKPDTLTKLNPSLRETVINPESESWWPNMLARRDQMQQAVDAAQGAEKTEAQANLDSFLIEMAQWEAQRYLVTEQGIARYRALHESGYVRSYGSLAMGLPQKDTMSLLLRFAWGQMTLDEFLGEAEQRLRLMRLESR